MNLNYMKVSLFEISYKKKWTFSRHDAPVLTWNILSLLGVLIVYYSGFQTLGRNLRDLKENTTVFPYSNMFFPQLRRVDMYLSRLSPCT